MNLHKKIAFSNNFLILLCVFIIVHLFLFNYNAAEWGDSYRILRAAETLRSSQTYPIDEKRPPLFSLILSTRPNFVDAITYGRAVVLLLSLATFIVFYTLLKSISDDVKWVTWGSLAFLFNNVLLYWSIRVMTDILFSFFVVLALYLFGLWKKSLTITQVTILGILGGLAVLTRFEGYILGFALAAGVFFASVKKLKSLFVLGLSSLVVLAPYLYFRNPFGSSYFEETTRRTYDINVMLTFLVSLVSVLGIPSLWAVVVTRYKHVITFSKQNLVMTTFFVLQLLLILAWPAAIPRLFVPIISILILYIVISLKDFFAYNTLNFWRFLFLNLVLLGFYVTVQYNLKLQFLLLDKRLFVINVLLQMAIILSLIRKKLYWFFLLSLTTMILWSAAIINMHKNIFISVKSAAQYTAANYSGNIAFNDVSSVSDWYLNFNNAKKNTRGFYYNTEKKQYLDQAPLKAAAIDYLLITNEHNTTMTLDLNKRPFLKELKVFEYVVNGQKFITRLVKVL